MTLSKTPDLLIRLQDWYAAHLDGVWEHSYGIEIGTLDNPGWSVRIDLTGTSHQDVPFQEVRHNYEDPEGWYSCRRVGATLEGHGGPKQLESILSCLLIWLEAPPS
jgi:hypothetical protein